jgi:hypothetical protein
MLPPEPSRNLAKVLKQEKGDMTSKAAATKPQNRGRLMVSAHEAGAMDKRALTVFL